MQDPANSHLMGFVAPIRTVTIEADRLRQFAEAISENDSVYFDKTAARAAGHRDILAPATYAFCLERMASASFDLLEQINAPPEAMLHGEHSFEYFAPMYAGDEIALASRSADVDLRAGGAQELVTLETDARNQHGTLCNRQRFTVAVRLAPAERSRA